MADFDNSSTGEPGRDRIEELLRRSLETRAQDIRPDPATWQKVSGKVRRAQIVTWTLAGAGAVGAVVLAAVVLPGLLRGSTVELDRDFGDPAPLPTVSESAAEGGVPCGGSDRLAAVFARTGEELEGTLWARCGDGSETMLGQDRQPGSFDTNPTLSWDGRELVFERVDGNGDSLLVHLNLETGTEQILMGGRLPAFAPDGRMAWVQPVEGGNDLILVGRLFSEPELEFPVVEGDDGEYFDVRRLAFDATGETLYAEAGYEESVVFSYDVGSLYRSSSQGSAAPTRLEEPINEERYAGPSAAPEGYGAALIARCCLAADGQAFDRADLRLVSEDDARLVNQVPEGFDADGPMWTAFIRVGEIQAQGDQVRWTGGNRSAWLLGDGDRVWLMLGDGEAYALTDAVSVAAANPTMGAAGSGEGPATEAPDQEGLSPEAALTRQRIWEAAAARDYEALGELMGPEYSSSFAAENGREAGVAELRRIEAEGTDPFALIRKLLSMSYGIQEREGGPSPLYSWPAVYGKTADQWTEEDEAQLRELGTEEEVAQWREFGHYLGWRVGIDASGAWLYFVAGD